MLPMLQLFQELHEFKRTTASVRNPDGGAVDRLVVLTWLLHRRVSFERRMELCLVCSRDKCMEGGYQQDAQAMAAAWQVSRWVGGGWVGGATRFPSHAVGTAGTPHARPHSRHVIVPRV